MFIDPSVVHNPFGVITAVIGLLHFTQVLQLNDLIIPCDHQLLDKLLHPLLQVVVDQLFSAFDHKKGLLVHLLRRIES